MNADCPRYCLPSSAEISKTRTLGTVLAPASLLAIAAAGVAVEHDAKPGAKPTALLLSEILAASGVTATGYVDGTYSYLTRSPEPDPSLDTNAFALNQASLTLAYTPATEFGVLVNAVAGTEACDGCYTPGYGSLRAHAGFSNINLLQGHVQYVTGKATIMGGKSLTLAGTEVTAPTGNANVTRSLLFWYSEPDTYVGPRVVYAPSDRASFTAAQRAVRASQRPFLSKSSPALTGLCESLVPHRPLR